MKQTLPDVTWSTLVGDTPRPVDLGEIARVRLTTRFMGFKLTVVAVVAGEVVCDPFPHGSGFWVDGSKPITYDVKARGIEFSYLNWVGIDKSDPLRYTLTAQVADALGIQWRPI